MGLDILIGTNNPEDFQEEAYEPSFQLSRSFCDLMGQRHMGDIENPQFDQVAKITRVDLTPLYEMGDYFPPEDIERHLQSYHSAAEKARALQEITAANAAVAGNLVRVRTTVETLLQQLAKVDDLADKLVPDDYEMVDNEVYFAYSGDTESADYEENTFDQDLRNLKRFLDYAAGKGSHTVFFVFG
jgi:hypothetical protein